MKRAALLTVGLAMVLLIFAGCPFKGPSNPLKPWTFGDANRITSFKYATEVYATSATISGTTQIEYVFFWGDGTQDTSDAYPSAETATLAHTWLAEGTYKIKVRAFAVSSPASLIASKDYSPELTITVGPNRKPNPPDVPSGLGGGIKKEALSFTTTATDSDGDSIQIQFWTDTVPAHAKASGWLPRNGHVPSGGTVEWDSATYATNGTFYMYARARDSKGAISDRSGLKKVVIQPMEVDWAGYDPTDSSVSFNSSPAVGFPTGGADTILYIGSDNTDFFGFNAINGGSKGSYTSIDEGSWSASPAVSPDQKWVYCGDDDGFFYCFAAGHIGSPTWHTPDSLIAGMTPFYTAPAVTGNDVFVGRDNGVMYHYVNTASAGQLSLVDSFASHADISPSPALSVDGSRLVFGNDSDNLYCLATSNLNNVLWKVALGAPMSSSPAIANGKVYVGCDDQNLYEFDLATGGQIRAYPANDFISGSPVVVNYGAGDDVYFASDGGTVYGLRHDGTNLSVDLPNNEDMSATPVLAPDTTLILNTDDGSVYGIDISDPTALTVKWRFELPVPGGKKALHALRAGRHSRIAGKTASLCSSPSLVPGAGHFYVGSPNGGVYGVKVDKPSWTNPAAWSNITGWLKFHHDPNSSGHAND